MPTIDMRDIQLALNKYFAKSLADIFALEAVLGGHAALPTENPIADMAYILKKDRELASLKMAFAEDVLNFLQFHDWSITEYEY